ncbi:MAG: alpha-galactosidase, partial [Victivallales bacterium]|nr:alpha-galactosidase [Victivallales bacterium]
RVHSCCWGISPTDLRLGEWHHGYRHVTILGRPEDEFSTLVKEYCAARFPLKEHEAAVLVNPWGCGHFPEWNCPAFMQEEIRAAGEAGAEVYQLDDSWQQCHGTARSTGIGLAEMTSNNRAMDMDFWKISPERLPDGFEPIVAAAEKAGIKLGLWCAPTYNSLYQDWEAFAEMLLDYHRRYGFATVKVDGVRLQRHEAECALNKLLEKVRRESDGKVFFNLDTTNGQRPGYFYFLEYGNIFLENRYVYSQKVIGYHPEKTLRNLWMLSRYVRTQTLQVEVPAPDDIPADMEFVRDPREYSFEYWCAAAIFANMLIWTAPSRLSPENFAVLKKMIAVHKQLRRRFFNSVISPVGDCPDGRAISGLLSTGGCAVYFREAGCPNSTTELPHGSNHRILAGNGKITGSAIELPPCGYIILEFDTP